MKRKISGIILAFIAAFTLLFSSAASVLADKGGVPNDNAENGAAHADDNSAHYKNAPPEPPPDGDTGVGI